MRLLMQTMLFLSTSCPSTSYKDKTVVATISLYNMKKIITFILVLLGSFGVKAQDRAVKAYYDERIELMSIICHLAGFQEYNMNVGGDYITDIDNYFADVRNHPAVEMMDSLRRVNGISFDSPMAFAVNLKKAGNSFVLVNDSVAPERRWNGNRHNFGLL